MENYARKLGAKNTVITNASGLPKPVGMLTTPEDSLLFIQALRRNKTLAAAMAKRTFDLKSKKGRVTSLTNHNKLLWKYEYPVRGKTGYTLLARNCFLSWADYKGRKIAISIMGAPGNKVLWKDVQRAYYYVFATNATFMPHYMRQRGISVKHLQAALKQIGISYKGKENYYGPHTRDLVKIFQKKHNLSVDGIAGTQTWRQIRRELD